MSVVIEEMVHEVGSAAPQRSAESSGAGPMTTKAPDLERLEFHLGRRRHRAERLWAD